MVTALTTATAAGSPTRPNANAGPRSQFPIFVLDQGRFTRFDPPGPVDSQRNADNPVRINNRGQISGVYLQGDAQQGSGPLLLRFRGFLRDPRGRISRIDVPGAAGTIPFDLNDRGQLVGIYSTTSPNPSGAADTRGFLRDARGRFTTIRVPGAVQTQARGINNRGQVIGEYTDAAGGFHGFLWDKGRVVTLDRGPVDAVVCCSALDINDRGQVVAAFLNAAGNLQGVLLDRGRATTISAPGIPSTLPTALNNRGRIVGATSTGPGQEPHGFLLRGGAGGPFTPIDVPGAPGTSPTGINDAGVIVGVYTNPNATPSPQPATMPMGLMSAVRP